LGNWAVFTDVNTWLFLWDGLIITVRVAIVSTVLSIIFGIIFALGRLSSLSIIHRPAAFYVEVVRALPVFLLIIWTFFALPKLGLQVPVEVAVIAALTIYTTSVVAEIIRAGILSIEKGQMEAARSLGFSYLEAMRYIILPQALRRMVPPLVSQFITLLKDTSLGTVLGLRELLRSGEIIYRGVYKGQLNNNPIETLFVVAIIYFILCYSLSLLSQRLELSRVVR